MMLLHSPDLTWRDVQYLIVYTSNPSKTDDLYVKNGAGILTSREFGFGVMDAEAMVTRARSWVNVPPQLENHINSTATGYVAIGPEKFKILDLHYTCIKININFVPKQIWKF